MDARRSWRPMPMVVLALTDGSIAFLAFYAATALRFGHTTSHATLRAGGLWVRALVFACVVVACLLSLDLYRRARAQAILRVLAAMAVAMVTTGAIFVLVPGLWIGAGVTALAAILAGSVLVASREVLRALG